MQELKEMIKEVLDKPKMSTLSENLIGHVITAQWVTNGLLFYVAALWTVRLFQPLKVFQ